MTSDDAFKSNLIKEITEIGVKLDNQGQSLRRVESTVAGLDRTIRGTEDKAGLVARTASLESSRSQLMKLMAAVWTVLTAGGAKIIFWK